MTEARQAAGRTSGSCPSLPGWLPQQRFTLFAQFATFRDVAQAGKFTLAPERICASRSPRMLCGRYIFSFPPVPARQRVPPPRHIFEQVFHRRTDGIAIDGDVSSRYSWHKRKVSSPMRFTAHLRQTAPRVADQPDDLHSAPFQAGGVFRFHGNHFDLRHQCLISTATPAARPPPPTGTNTGRDGRPAGAVPAPACLARRSHRMVERRHPGEALLL